MRTKPSLIGAAPYVATVVLGLAVYLRAVTGPFIWDDYFLLDQLERYRGSLSDVFTSGFLVRPTGDGADFYRPLVTLSLIFDQAVWGNNSVGFHITNMALHGLSILMVALFTWLLVRQRIAAIASAFLFAVHPVHAESVCWISGRTDLICAVFLFGGLNLYLLYRHTGKRVALGASYLLIALALLSKELAVLTPVLVALAAWGAGERNYRRIIREALPFILIVLVYVGARSSVLHGAEPLVQSPSLVYRVSTFAYSLFTHFQILLLPQTAHLSYEVVMQEIAHAGTFVMLFSLVVLMWFLWSARATAPIPFFGFLWFLLTILPVSMAGGSQVAAIVSQRFLYIPSVGLAVVFGWAVAHLFRSRKPIKALASGIAVVIVAAFCMLSVRQSALWASEVAFWEEFVRDTPTIGWSYYHLGMAYHRAKKYERAIKAYKAATDLMPERSEPQYGMGKTYEAMGDSARADEHFMKAFDLQQGGEIPQVIDQRFR